MSTKPQIIFDVDGTLTQCGCAMDPDFQRWFLEFCSRYSVYLVSGRSRSALVEQLGQDIYNTAKTVYANSGNDVWQADHHVRSQIWYASPGLMLWLEDQVVYSVYPGVRTGAHVQRRVGGIHFSVVGENANSAQRAQYAQWDSVFHERASLAQRLQWYFSDLDAAVGGDIGIDIYPRGCDKSQILADFAPDVPLIFYGDRLEPGGDDSRLAQAIIARGSQAHAVLNWQHTWKLLWELWH